MVALFSDIDYSYHAAASEFVSVVGRVEKAISAINGLISALIKKSAYVFIEKKFKFIKSFYFYKYIRNNWQGWEPLCHRIRAPTY